MLARLLVKHYGKHALLIGVPNQYALLEATKVPCHTLLSSFLAHEPQPGFVEGDLHELAIQTGSIDLVILPHTLEYVDNPHHLVQEACRVVKPEGLIVIMGFNPYSMCGFKRLMSGKRGAPWSSHFAHAYQVKHWLRLSDFQIERQTSCFSRPPIEYEKVFNKLEFLECVGDFLNFFGGIYCITARAKVVPMTPIRMQWKQKLNHIRIATTISGSIARQIDKQSH